MKYTDLIFESLKKTALKRIRVKVDPALVSAEADFSKIDGYEGYVLEEGKSHLKILILTPELGIEDVPVEFIEAIADDADQDYFNSLKEYIIRKILSTGKVENDPIIQQIKNSDCINNIEQLIRQYGYTGENLAELYRGFINEEN